MIWWKRKNDGFVWREYVRTTVLVRRDQRRQRIEDIRAAAIEGAKDAGRQGLDAGRKGVALGTDGAKRAARGLWRGLYLGVMGAADVLVAVAAATWLWLLHTAGPALAGLTASAGSFARMVLGPVVRPLIEALRTPLASPVLALAGSAAAVSYAASWLNSESAASSGSSSIAAVVAVTTGALLTLAHWPLISATLRLDRLQWPRGGPMFAAIAGLAVLAGGFAVWSGWVASGIGAVTSGASAVVSGGTGLIAGGGTVEGRAVVSSAARMKIAGTELVLYGVEAPESGQVCGSKTCATAAKSALQKLVQGKRVTCQIAGTNAGMASGTCKADGVDIAAQLVRAGHVFATTGLFPPYASQEREARNSRAGIWKSNAERPSEHRSKTWNEAAKNAPDGCPIKGVVTGDTKTFVAPWSANYDKAKVKTSRGDRWFCSEAEARAAGWRPAESL